MKEICFDHKTALLNTGEDAKILKEALEQVIVREHFSVQSLETMCKVRDYLASLCEIPSSGTRVFPLTLVELRQMNGQTVYCLDLNEDVEVIAYKKGPIRVTDDKTIYCATGLTLYRKKPVEFETLI